MTRRNIGIAITITAVLFLGGITFSGAVRAQNTDVAMNLASARRSKPPIAVKVSNQIGNTQWATVRMWVNGRLLGEVSLLSGKTIQPYPMVYPGNSIKIEVRWRGQTRQLHFRAQKKPERVYFIVQRHKLILRRA